jgi:hypothetical protein
MATKTIDCSGITVKLLQPTNYELVFGRLPNTVFACQEVTPPDVTFGTATAAFSAHDVHLEGEKLTFGTFKAKVLHDEQLSSYFELYNWMKQISVLGAHAEYTSDCHLYLGSRRFYMEGVYPTALLNSVFSSILSDTPPMTFDVEFQFIKYDLY